MSKMNGKFAMGEYTLTFNVNTFCDLEDAFEVADVNGVLAVMQSMETTPSLRVMRKIFYAALRGEHPEMTLEGAGDVISDIGLEVAAEAMQNAVADVFPDDEPDEVGNAPKKAKAKAGK
jgi:hypothetical protein